MPSRETLLLILLHGALAATAGTPATAQSAAPTEEAPAAVSAVAACDSARALPADRNATEDELRCRFGAEGDGRFGLLSYADVPVYQPATPMPGTHMVGLPGQPGPTFGESYEAWELRMLRTAWGESGETVYRELELMDPIVASRVIRFERLLEREGVVAWRRETWRSPARQAHLFQRGRSRPGGLATATLTSWHCQVDERGNPAARAADYHVAGRHLVRFHELAAEAGLWSFGADSNDPGHVFLPDETATPRDELALLRVLPRVPVVTLATGRPVDAEPLDGGKEALRRMMDDFLAGLTLPRPTLQPSGRTVPEIASRAAAGSHKPAASPAD